MVAHFDRLLYALKFSKFKFFRYFLPANSAASVPGQALDAVHAFEYEVPSDLRHVLSV